MNQLRPRSFVVETYGCQMNVHDSERISGLLVEAGYKPAVEGSEPDLIVFNTCAVRENADNKLYGNLSFLAPRKRRDKNFQIAIGGCMAQKDQDLILKKAPYVDVVFGTHNIGSLPVLLERARIEEESQIEIKEALEHFPSTLPARRDNAYSAWVSISVGCNNTCTFCIVPQLRGVEKDRTESEIIDEVSALAEQGVIEVTLLGQNVNAYGRARKDPGAFARLLAATSQVPGIKRVRFTSPHPKDFTEDVIEVMATYPNIAPHLHMPLQSGSDQILQAMRRSYRRTRYLEILDSVRSSIKNATITTDIIVGFPGETEEDFQDTYNLVAQANFLTSYIFLYSPRPGTPAATMENQIPEKIKKERFHILNNLQQEISGKLNAQLLGQEVEVLVTARDTDKEMRVSGRAFDFRLVHLNPGNTNRARPGDLVRTKITSTTPNFLLADEDPLEIIRTKGADKQAERDASNGNEKIMLGLPTLKTLKDQEEKHQTNLIK